ncbi:MAG TPA: hypothetical protein VN903_23165 [Polyangia bacterium]|jgi:hypothetical protein|nr:hypothetical protein [Polyangia bacterium]
MKKTGGVSTSDRHLAFSFRSDLATLDEVWHVLNQKSSLKWRGADSDRYAKVYLWSETLRDGLTSFRIFVDDDGVRFVVSMSYLFGVPDSMPYEEVRSIVDKEILPLLGARDIQPHEGWPD